MTRRNRIRRPSAATVLAVVAIVLACTGSAFAGGTLISGTQIKNNTITGSKIRAASVHLSDLAPDARSATTTATAAATVTREAHAMGAGPVSVTCLAGEHATGGGGNSPGMWKSQPHSDVNGLTDGWTVQGRMPDTVPQGDATGTGPSVIGDQMTVAYVICAS